MSKPVRDPRTRAAAPPFTTCVRAFEHEFDYVFRALRRHGVAPADAEDLAQDVFLIMWRRWADYDGERPLRPWLAGIAFRLAYNHRLRRGRESLRGALDLVGDAPNPEEALAAQRARSLVLAALAGLPERHRAPVVLSDLDGLPMPEVAAILGVPLATAYTRVRRGRQAFAAEVARRGSRPGSGRSPAARRGRPAGAGAHAAAGSRAGPPPRAGPGGGRRLAPARPRASAHAARARAGAPADRAGAVRRARRAGRLALAATSRANRSRGGRARGRAGGRRRGVPGIERRLRGAERRRLPAFARAAGAPTPAPLLALAEGLAGYWRFDDGRSAAFARDLSGRGNDCRLRGLDPTRAWTAGVHGSAIDLRGRRGHLECRQHRLPALAPDAITIAAWVSRAKVQRHHTALVTREVARGDRDDYFFGFWGDSLKVSSAAWTQSTTARFSPPAGRWSHVAFSHAPDGTTVLYLDGREIAREQGSPRPVVRGSRNLLIGAGHSTGQVKAGQNFDGLLDELVVYDRALAPAEIAALAAGAQPALSL